MAITSVGTPTAATGTTGSQLGTWGTGQNRVQGNVLVAVVTFTSATTTTATGTATSGWINLLEVATTATKARTAIWWKIAVGGDTAPTFTSTVGTTPTSFVTLYELSGANGYVTVTTGTAVANAATVASQTATTGGNVSASGEFGIAGFCRERASTAAVVTAGTYTLDASNTGVTSTGHSASMSLASPGSGATSSATVTYSLGSTTCDAAGAIVIFGLALPGPAFVPLDWPPGVRVIWLRTGSAQASLLRGAAVTPPAPGTGPVFRQATAPAMARTARTAPRGRTTGNKGAPVHNPVILVPPVPLHGPVRARQPMPPHGGWAATMAALTVTIPPGSGPPFYPLRQPARTRIVPPPRGRAQAGRGAPVHNPVAGPVFRLPRQPARAPVPATFSRGRGYGSKGAPLANPVSGPVFRQATQPIRSRVPQVFSRGRAEALRGAPRNNPVSGPALRPLTGPVQARRPLFLLGRAQARPGAPVRNPVAGPAVRALQGPVRSRQPLPLRGRAATSSAAKAVLPPPVTLAVAYPLTRPVAARRPLILPGRAATMSLLPFPVQPTSGPQLYPLQGPVRARQPLPPHGRAYGNKGAPVSNPANSPGPPFYPLRQPARIRITLPPRGHLTGSPGAPVRNPVRGPLAYPLHAPVRARQPLPRHGRAATSGASPVTPPPPPGARLRALQGPVRTRPVPPFLAGRAATMSLLPFPVAPPSPASSAPLYPLTQPVRARQALPARGRAQATPLPAQVPAPFLVPQAPLSQPAGIRVSFLRTGHVQTRSTPSVPVAPPPAVPFRQSLNKATRAQPPVFLKGRIISSGGAPVRNPGHGPRAYPLHGPVRGQPAFPFRTGRAAGSGGAPVTFPPVPPAIAAGLLSITPAGRQAAVMSIRLAMAATTDISQLVPAAVTASDPVPYHRPETITASPGTARIRPADLVTLDPPGPLRT